MLPYCVATTAGGGNGTTTKCTPGRYECLGTTAMQVCNYDGVFVKVGDCPAGTKCGLLGGIPYCL